MHAAYGLSARVVDNKAIYIEAKYTSTTVCVYGATMPMSCRPMDAHDRGIENFTLYPEVGKDGIVAVCISSFNGSGKNTYTSWQPNFLKVSWNEGKLSVDLETAWVAIECIGQVTKYGIEVEIDGKRLKTPTVDGNLLCRYLWGTASKEDVLSTVAAKAEELSAVERLKEFKKSHQILLQQRDDEIRHLTSLLEVKTAAHREALDVIKEYNALVRTASEDLGKFRRLFVPQSWHRLNDLSVRIVNHFEPKIRDAT